MAESLLRILDQQRQEEDCTVSGFIVLLVNFHNVQA
jgi:hypothetical protein